CCWANLQQARLTGADLTETSFLAADLRDANLHDTQLVRVNLRSADLRGAQVLWLHLMDAVILHGTDLCGAILDDPDPETPFGSMGE
ncbi:MAG: pentapeptide repeat-containing protein, partial [Ktedonobacteraceae bacterium]|nr:pentapeptide repeat-containing protein [Ktedonobacteraceae bacterium]